MNTFSEDGIEAAARAVNRLGWTCFAGTDEPGNYDSCADCRRVARDVVTAVIEYFDARCGYDAVHDHGSECTTDCVCGRGRVDLQPPDQESDR